MSNFLLRFLDRRLNFTQPLLPKHCLLCLASCEGDLCSACYESLPRLPTNHCSLCLLPSRDSRICGACLANHPCWSRAVAALQYAFPVDALIRTLKYRGDLTLAPVLAELLIARLTPFPLPDGIIPVPLHSNRLKERGFNQATEIGRHLSRQMGVPLLPHACIRIKDTLSQTELSWNKRRGNIRNAFACTTRFAQQHVAILDDVMTSGATLNELARMIRKQGANEISVWVITRAMLSSAANKAVKHRPLS